MTWNQLHTQDLPELQDDRWQLLNWSSNLPGFGLLVRVSSPGGRPIQNNTYGFCGIYQVVDGRVVVFNNQTLFALPGNGDIWGTLIPPQTLLINDPANPGTRFPWGVIVSIHRWMTPCTITLERRPP